METKSFQQENPNSSKDTDKTGRLTCHDMEEETK